MDLAAAVLSGFLLAPIAPALHRVCRGAWLPWLLALWPLALFLTFCTYLGFSARGGVRNIAYDWAPSLGVSLSFTLDGLSLLFALLISGIGALIFVYAGGYLRGHRDLGRFYAFLIFFTASMLGLVLAANVLTLFLFWELTSISSYLLIGFDHEREVARGAAQQALLVTGAGGLALLAGLLILGQVGGSLELPELLAQGSVLQERVPAAALLLILIGAFTKSAQFPFHFWLPGAMEAPTPVSAFLHSATMVKAGVYLLARLAPIFAGSELWLVGVTVTGGVTMLVGAYLALYRTDLKQILAYSTISALGTLTLLLGLGTPQAIKATVVFLLAHALYKGALFMIAGIVDHETGTRAVDRLGGLRRAMPVTAAVAAVAALSLAGLGPLFSFIGKELLFEAAWESRPRLALVVVTTLAGALLVAVAIIVGYRPFAGSLKPTTRAPHDPDLSLLLGPTLLASLGVIFAVIPGALARAVVAPTVADVLGRAQAQAPLPPVNLALWHGWNPALAMSAASIALGLGIYRQWEALRWVTDRAERILRWGPARIYAAGLDALLAFAAWQMRRLQNGYLRRYLLVLILSFIGLTAYGLIGLGGLGMDLRVDGRVTDARPYEIGLAGLILAAAAAAVVSASRLAAVAALGVVGYGVALIYLLFGAPDLAMTQFLVETLTVILFVLVFYHLPVMERRSGAGSRVRDAVVAILAGGLVTALLLVAIAVRSPSALAEFYAARSLPDAHGRNIVNVILVDFRGLDTLGEITVLAVAAIGVYALLKLRKDGSVIEAPGSRGGPSARDGYEAEVAAPSRRAQSPEPRAGA